MHLLLEEEIKSNKPNNIWNIYPQLEIKAIKDKNHTLINTLRQYGDEELLIHLIETTGVISLTDYEEATGHDWATDRQMIILERGLK